MTDGLASDARSLERKETEYLVFAEIPHSMHGGKTRRWQVLSKSSGTLLGRIKWHGPWRQFTFFPEGDTIFNVGCMVDICAMIELAMKDWRASRTKR